MSEYIDTNLRDSAYNITPIDGRYWKETGGLRPIVSEFGLMKNRILVESKHLISLSEYPGVDVVRKLSYEEKELLIDLYRNFSVKDYERIKEIEESTDHDVKAVELFFREKLRGTPVEDLASKVHIFLTSEDPNNIAYSLMLKEAMFKFYLPRAINLVENIMSLASAYKTYKMLGRTHGQPALPTKLKKQLVVYAVRLTGEIEKLSKTKFTAKMTGAVGDYNAFKIAFPKVNWIKYSKKLIEELGLEPRVITTQILPHEEISGLLRNIVSLNQILRDFDENMWRYISDDWFLQIPKKEEVGSSTMPQKINPRHFENSEGNTKISSALATVLADELQRSRLQRDLSGSTLQRWYGTAIATSLQAINRAAKALGKVLPSEEALNKALENHPEVIMEAVQTIGRIEGIQDIYDRSKNFSRGKKLTLGEIRTFIRQLPLSEKKKKKLSRLTPFGYVGEASKLSDIGIRENRKTLKKVKKKLDEYYNQLF